MKRAALLLIGLAACDPVRWVHTDVKSVATCGGAAAPVDRANVTLDCPNQAPFQLGTTDANGTLTYVSVGLFDEGCAVRVSKEGFVDRSYPVADACTSYSGDRCWMVAITTDLSPKP